MQPEMVEKLLRLNQDFYATYAQSFAATRHTVQPGVQHLLPRILQGKVLLDLGCGNGNLAELLKSKGFCGIYIGVDENAYFLEQAAASTQDASTGSYVFLQGSLAEPNWMELVNPADTICSFATLHHLPGADLHRQFFSTISSKLSPSGRFFLSCWQVLGNERLEKHLVPWNPADIEAEYVDEQDLLMDWRADPGKPARLRYVHHFSPSELRALGESQGLLLQHEFFSDGKEGNLGLYQVWQKPGI
jgi:SAM-dependent methyltransferase